MIRRDDRRGQREALGESTFGIAAQCVAVLAVHEDVTARLQLIQDAQLTIDR